MDWFDTNSYMLDDSVFDEIQNKEAKRLEQLEHIINSRSDNGTWNSSLEDRKGW